MDEPLEGDGWPRPGPVAAALLRRQPAAARDDPGRHGPRARRVRLRDAPRRRVRLRPARAAHGARLPPVLVPLPAHEPPPGRVRRHARRARALPARGPRRVPRRLARGEAAVRAHLGDRLASRRLRGRGRRRARADAARARRRRRRRLDRAGVARRPSRRSGAASRRRSPTGSATRSTSRPSPSARSRATTTSTRRSSPAAPTCARSVARTSTTRTGRCTPPPSRATATREWIVQYQAGSRRPMDGRLDGPKPPPRSFDPDGERPRRAALEAGARLDSGRGQRAVDGEAAEGRLQRRRTGEREVLPPGRGRDLDADRQPVLGRHRDDRNGHARHGVDVAVLERLVAQVLLGGQAGGRLAVARRGPGHDGAEHEVERPDGAPHLGTEGEEPLLRGEERLGRRRGTGAVAEDRGELRVVAAARQRRPPGAGRRRRRRPTRRRTAPWRTAPRRRRAARSPRRARRRAPAPPPRRARPRGCRRSSRARGGGRRRSRRASPRPAGRADRRAAGRPRTDRCRRRRR